MKQKQYTIQELSELTGFSRRTIRYYIQEGLLEPPAGRGRGGYYYDSHLNALSKIRRLQNQGLRLSAISTILKEAVTETLEKVIVPSRDTAWYGDDVDKTMFAEESEDVRFKQQSHPVTARLRQPSDLSRPLHDPEHPHSLLPSDSVLSPQPPSRQVWIRYPIVDGVALHIRRDIDINQRKKIDQLIRLADAILNTSAKGEGSDE